MTEPKLFSDDRVVSVGNADATILGPNPRRQYIIVSNCGAGNLFIRFRQPAANNGGMLIPPTTLPFQITVGMVGQAIHEEVHAICPAGAQNVYVLDVFTG